MFTKREEEQIEIAAKNAVKMAIKAVNDEIIETSNRLASISKKIGLSARRIDSLNDIGMACHLKYAIEAVKDSNCEITEAVLIELIKACTEIRKSEVDTRKAFELGKLEANKNPKGGQAYDRYSEDY